VTNKHCRLSPDTVNTLVTLSQNIELVDWRLQNEKPQDKSENDQAKLVGKRIKVV
jgi:hypothetical protein